MSSRRSRWLAVAGLLERGGGRPAAALLLLLLLAVRISDPAPLEGLRARGFDLLQRLHPRRADADRPPVLVVDLDEDSLRRVGQWPWPRDRVAELVDRVAAQGPAAVGLDMLFPEPDGSSPERILGRFPGLEGAAREALAALPANDALLAESLSRARAVLGMAPVLGSGKTGAAFRHAPARLTGDVLAALPAFDAVVRSIDPIDAAAAGHASLVTTPEPDGIVRRLPSAVRVGDAVIPALSVEVLRVGAGAAWFGLAGGPAGVATVEAGPFRAPTEPDGRLWVPFTPHGDWRFVPAHRVLSGDIPPDLFRGRVILLGTTALGLADLHATPLGPKMHGLEIHAQLVEGILTGSVLRRPAWASRGETLATAAAGLILILLAPTLPVRWSFLLLAAVAMTLLGGAWSVYVGARLLLDASFPVVASTAVFTLSLAGRLVETERARHEAEAALQAERERALRLEGEMEAARQIQMGMLPRNLPATPDGRSLDIHTLILPAQEVGGDLYDFFPLDDGRLFFLIGDVSGKGAPAALFMALTKAACKTAALRPGTGVAQVLDEASDAVARESGGTMFVTLLAGILDGGGNLEWVNAGHEPPFLVGPPGGLRRLEQGGGPPLGAVEGFPYAAERTVVPPGASLVLVTDGVTEAVNRTAERFGVGRASAVLAEASGLPAAGIIARLRDAVERFADGAAQTDDMTILAIRRPGPRGSTPPA